MRPLRHPLVPDGRGRRTPQTLLLIDERDKLLIEAAHFFPDTSQREAARQIHTALSRYREGRRRRERVETTCPVQHRGKLAALLYALLRTRDQSSQMPSLTMRDDHA